MKLCENFAFLLNNAQFWRFSAGTGYWRCCEVSAVWRAFKGEAVVVCAEWDGMRGWRDTVGTPGLPIISEELLFGSLFDLFLGK